MQVEIWSDVVCPWCAIGAARFEKALAAFPHRDEVEVQWRSFQLDPSTPAGATGDVADHLAAKYGVSRERALEMNAQVTATAAADGLDFRFERAQRSNTFDAHRLLHLAADRGVTDAVKDRLFRAYFTNGESIGDLDTLVRIGTEAGLDPTETRAVLTSDRYADAVRADVALATDFGITGVPFFVIDRKFGLSGAQPVATFATALTEAWEDMQPFPDDAQACGDGGCSA